MASLIDKLVNSLYEEESNEDKKDSDISSLDKDDLSDDGNTDESAVALSVKLTSNKLGSKIRLLTYKQLEDVDSIESLISFFSKNDLEKIIGNKLTIELRTNNKEFSDRRYKIVLRDKVGSISVHSKDFNSTVIRESRTDLEQATSNQLEEKEKSINLDYLDDLNKDFNKLVKELFINELLDMQYEKD